MKASLADFERRWSFVKPSKGFQIERLLQTRLLKTSIIEDIWIPNLG